MKTTTLVVATLLATGFLLAAFPTGGATAFCTDAAERAKLWDTTCGSLVCYQDFCSKDLNPVCVTEPCPQPIP